MRQIFLDTETTGHEVADGGRIVELAGVESLPDGQVKEMRWYLNPERDIADAAYRIHGLSADFLADKPVFTDIIDQFLGFARGAELLMHNAPFDSAFLDAELRRAGCRERIGDICRVTDTLTLARERHPGQRNSLQALCQRYGVEASEREKKHGALVDAHLLRQVFQSMMSGQTSMDFDGVEADALGGGGESGKLPAEDRARLRVIAPSRAEWERHRERLRDVAAHSEDGSCVWREDMDEKDPR